MDAGFPFRQGAVLATLTDQLPFFLSPACTVRFFATTY